MLLTAYLLLINQIKYLHGYQPMGSCYFYPYGWEICSSQWESHRNAGVFHFNFLFSQKLLYCWHGIFWDNCSICRCDFGFLLTGDIPPSPGGVPISYTKYFLKVKLTTNFIPSWKIPISSSHFHFSYQTLGANKSANYNSYKFWLAIRSGNTNIRKFSCSTRFAKSLQIIVFRYNQLLCRV